MKNTWEKHIAMIESACVLRWANDTAVWYEDDGVGYCELRNGASFPCDSFAEFEELCEFSSEFDEPQQALAGPIFYIE